jgi:hypothetical protein
MVRPAPRGGAGYTVAAKMNRAWTPNSLKNRHEFNTAPRTFSVKGTLLPPESGRVHPE